MTQDKRDPRRDPRPGDVLKVPSEQRELLGIENNLFHLRSYDLSEEHTPRLNARNLWSTTRTEYLNWAKDVEVIHASD
jgi:hypothetical protein